MQDQEKDAQRCRASEADFDAILRKRTRCAGHRHYGDRLLGATKCAVNAISEAFRQEPGPTIRFTIISPGAVTSELHDRTKDPILRENIRSFYEIAIPGRAIADAVLYAMSQPPDVDINEIIIRPTAQEP